MQSPCYRCGSPVEEGVAFCPSCNAPQIKVAVPAAPVNEPSTRPLPPGTPDSIQPPAYPVYASPAGRIQWKDYRRIAVPLSVVAGTGIAFIAPIGLVIFFGAIVYAVNYYRRQHPAPLSPLQGARMGAFNGLISFVVAAVLQAALNHGEYRQQMMLELQRRFAGNPDPQVQQFVHWASSTQGFTVLVLFTIIFLLVIFLIVSSFAGMLTVAFSTGKDRR